MFDILIDTIFDSLKLLPFLFLAFLLIEYLEHKIDNKKIIEKNNKFGLGPIIGSILGAIPQCGFSVLGTNLFSTRIITIGTLIAIYLSTSDEMLPIMISQKVDILTVFEIIMIKVFVGIISGIIIDLFIKNKNNKIETHCTEEHCDCEKSLLSSSIRHTLKIALFIFIVTFVLNFVMETYGNSLIEKIFLKNTIFSHFITSLVGLIPNCASSVIITELYLNNMISFGSLISGLLTGSGVAIIVLFKTNKNLKENLFILLSIYFIGVIVGIIIDWIGIIL